MTPRVVRVHGLRAGAVLVYARTERCFVARGRRGDVYFARSSGQGLGAASGSTIDAADLARLRLGDA